MNTTYMIMGAQMIKDNIDDDYDNAQVLAQPTAERAESHNQDTTIVGEVPEATEVMHH